MSAAELSGTIYYTVQDWIQGRVPALDVLSRRVYTTSAVGRIPLQCMCALTALVRSPFSSLSLHNNVMVERTARARAVATFHLNGAAVVPRGTSRSDFD